MSIPHVPDRSMVKPDPPPSGTIRAISYKVTVEILGVLPQGVVDDLIDQAMRSFWGDCIPTDAQIDEEMKERAGEAIEQHLRNALIANEDDPIKRVRVRKYDLTCE